ncbi:MAG: hypothetical protein AAFQ41_05085 [Cyanobacteria bacterium J06623_7]
MSHPSNLSIPEPPIQWHPRQICAAIFGLSWLTLQVGTPLFWLFERGFDPQPRQFGWQMYTNMAGGDRFQISTKNLQTQSINLEQHTHNIRPGLDYDTIFLAYLCQKFPQAQAAQRISLRENQPLNYQCPQ